MRMEKRTFRIGELAKHLKVERFVIRFWEKEFAIKTTRSIGGQRFYSETDFQTFTIIKELLYQKGFTIAGARKYISTIAKPTAEKSPILPSHKTTIDESDTENELMRKLLTVREQLVRLQELL